MIVGLGLDVIEVRRIEHAWRSFGKRFAERILHPMELERFNALTAGEAIFLASRFASKEAAAKALGTGFSQGVRPCDFCVVSDANGKPVLNFFAAADEQLRRLGGVSTALSLTHTKETAAAVVLIEA